MQHALSLSTLIFLVICFLYDPSHWFLICFCRAGSVHPLLCAILSRSRCSAAPVFWSKRCSACFLTKCAVFLWNKIAQDYSHSAHFP